MALAPFLLRKHGSVISFYLEKSGEQLNPFLLPKQIKVCWYVLYNDGIHRELYLFWAEVVFWLLLFC